MEAFPGPPPPKMSGKAIVAIVLAAKGAFVVPIIPSIIAIVLGFVARNEIRESGGQLTGEQLAFWAIIIGAIGMVAGPIVIALYLLLAFA